VVKNTFEDMTEFVHRYNLETAIKGYKECAGLFEVDLNRIRDEVEIVAESRDYTRYNELQDQLVR
jgi:hypothetical protein